MEYGRLPEEAELQKNAEEETENFKHGKITFKDVSLRYDAESKKVLKNVTFSTEASEKIGIVGRTGAGKSSLIVALFRLTEIEDSGTITIDEMDCAQMGLHELRKRISIIPQDPLLFSTTLRRNLDPFDQYNDSDIWSALEQVNFRSLYLGVFGVYTLGQKSSIYPKIHILKYHFLTKFAFSKSHFSQNSHFQNLIFHKIHIFQTSNSW